jgi:hypothetical protein
MMIDATSLARISLTLIKGKFEGLQLMRVGQWHGCNIKINSRVL